MVRATAKTRWPSTQNGEHIRCACKEYACQLAMLMAMFLCLLTVAGATQLPQYAWADTPASKQALLCSSTFDVTVNPDGSLDVRETREYVVFDSMPEIDWAIPTISGDGRHVDIQVFSAGIASEKVPEGVERTCDYQLAEPSDADADHVKLQLLVPGSSKVNRFFVEYKVIGAVTIWPDCAELMWRYASPSENALYNVTLTMHLPTSAGDDATSAKAEHVQAWFHHEVLAGTIETSDKLITVHIPSITDQDYAEVRAALPLLLFANYSDSIVGPSGEGATPSQRDAIVDQETARADERAKLHVSGRAIGANTQLSKGATNEAVLDQVLPIGIVVGVLWLVIIAGFAYNFYWRHKYRKSHEAYFKGKYWTKPPSDDHPAVIDYVWDGQEGGCEALTVALMHLERSGALSARIGSFVTNVNPHSSQSNNARLTLDLEAAKELTDPIDQATASLLLNIAGINSIDEAPGKASITITLSQFESFADADPEKFIAALKDWDNAVREEVSRRKLNDDLTHREQLITSLMSSIADMKRYRREHPGKKFLKFMSSNSSSSRFVGKILGISVFYSIPVIIAAVGAFISLHNYVTGPVLWSYGLTVPIILLPFGILSCALLTPFQFKCQYKLSGEAVEIRAKLEALRRWFDDLPDKVGPAPHDAQSWDRLLEMAIVLRVPKHVASTVKQSLSTDELYALAKGEGHWIMTPKKESKCLAQLFAEAYEQAIAAASD